MKNTSQSTLSTIICASHRSVRNRKRLNPGALTTAISVQDPWNPLSLAKARLGAHNMRAASGEGPGPSLLRGVYLPIQRVASRIEHIPTWVSQAGFSIYGGSRVVLAELVLTSGAKDYEGSPRLEFNLRRGCIGTRASVCTPTATVYPAFEHVVKHPSPVAEESYDRVFFRWCGSIRAATDLKEILLLRLTLLIFIFPWFLYPALVTRNSGFSKSLILSRFSNQRLI